jgi:hypothetical protein
MVDARSLNELPHHQYHSHLLPGVSVVIITHNRPRLLQRAFKSVSTAGSVCEIVVVDNASTDETAKICASLPGVQYVRIERPQTPGAARNIGLICSRGEFVSFLDDDDFRLEGSIARQLEVLKQQPDAAFVYGQARIDDPAANAEPDPYPKECLNGDIFWPLIERNFVPSGSVVYRRSCLTKAGLFEDCIAAAEDWDMCVRVAEFNSVAVLNAPVMTWRRSAPDSRQITSDAAMLVSIAVGQFRQWMKLPRAYESTRETRALAWQNFSGNMGEHLICEGARSMRRGRLAQSVRIALMVFKLEPFTLPRIVIKRWPQIWRALSQKQRPGFLAHSVDNSSD